MKLITLIYLEFFKTFAKWRTYIGFITISVVIPLVMYALYLAEGEIIINQARSLNREFFVSGNLFNGWAVAELIMNSLWVHIPFLITLVAGDQLAGEATSGTFRFILIRPISRSKFIFTKYISTIIYTALLVVTIALLSVGLGLYFFGSGDLIAFVEDTLVILPEEILLQRFILAYSLAILSMSVVASIAFLFSSFVENPIGPIIATMSVLVCLLIISNIPVNTFEAYKPYLFTTYQNAWNLAFDDVLKWDEIINAVKILSFYLIGTYLLTLLIFTKKDILS